MRIWLPGRCRIRGSSQFARTAANLPGVIRHLIALKGCGGHPQDKTTIHTAFTCHSSNSPPNCAYTKHDKHTTTDTCGGRHCRLSTLILQMRLRQGRSRGTPLFDPVEYWLDWIKDPKEKDRLGHKRRRWVAGRTTSPTALCAVAERRSPFSGEDCNGPPAVDLSDKLPLPTPGNRTDARRLAEDLRRVYRPS